VLHVSGFQVAGFRHVIGCLWPSFDGIGVEVAKRFYSDLFHHEDMLHDDKAVAVALQKAVVAVKNNHRKQPLLWAQFVHFGA
jgi:CHAT domain-containing protein